MLRNAFVLSKHTIDLMSVKGTQACRTARVM